jgi:hypothetical protein
MKGVVFTEFLAFVAAGHGEDVVDDIIAASALPHGGAYTSVGTYDHREIMRLCAALSQRSDIAVPDLLLAFGNHLAARFAALFPDVFARSPTLFDLLASIEPFIHVEVRKLYPDAQMPRFSLVERGPGRMVLDYVSRRHLSSLAKGLILGSARHYGVVAEVEDVVVETAGGPATRFTVVIGGA